MDEINYKLIIWNLFMIILSNLLMMYVVGYFYGDVSGSDVGYGLFRSTLSSPFDPSGWSVIIPDLPESNGAYEGFSYLGIGFFVLLFVIIVFRGVKPDPKDSKVIEFKVVWFAAIFLFIISLSNKIAIGQIELFEIKMPRQVFDLFSIFRSSGRHSWLFAFLALIWVVAKLNTQLKSRLLSYLLIFVLGLSIFDYSAQLTSQKHKRFKNLYETNLIDKAWKEINECYSSIRLYPPLPEIDNGYNFINLANNQRLSINIGRFARLDNNQLAISFEKMHNDFAMGSLEVESFYIFSSSKFVLPDVTNFHNNLAIFTSKNSTGWGILDGYAFIAPEIGTCDGAPNLKMNLTSLGVPQYMKYNLAEEINNHGTNKNCLNRSLFILQF
jgi:hypothetical protein